MSPSDHYTRPDHVQQTIADVNARLAKRNPAKLAERQFAVRRRGYDREEVDAFKAAVVTLLTELQRELSDVTAAELSVRKQLQLARTNSIVADVDPQAIHILAVAQQQADRIIQRSQEVARQTESAAQQYYTDVVAEAHRTAKQARDQAGPPLDPQTSTMADRDTRDRERSIAYLQTFLDVVRASRTEVGGLPAVLEHVLDISEQVTSGLGQIEQAASSALLATQQQAKPGRAHAANEVRETA
jgi:DivIVA domain-containing protein